MSLLIRSRFVKPQVNIVQDHDFGINHGVLLVAASITVTSTMAFRIESGSG